MYVLEGVTPCIQSMQLLAGDIGTFRCLRSRRFHFYNDVICLFIPYMFVCVSGYKLFSPFNIVVHFIQIIVRLHLIEQHLILLPKHFTCPCLLLYLLLSLNFAGAYIDFILLFRLLYM